MSSPPATVGPYRVLRLLGEGGMGAVFEAVHEDIERRVALKLLKPEFAKNDEAVVRFLNEARAVNRIEHPSLVQISDHGRTSDGAVYLVMEYLRGETLDARLLRLRRSGERLQLQQALHIAWQIAEALAVAHDKGVVHRDLKPDNIMLVPDPASQGGERAKILDFGIAKLMQTSHEVTVQPRLMGTPRYMAPEQIRSGVSIDGRADVYSLGVVLYLLVAGRTPFQGEGLEALLGQHLFAAPPSLAEAAGHAPRALVELVARMLEKNPEHRPTMAETVSGLHAIIWLPPEPAPAPEPVTALTVPHPPQAPTAFVANSAHREVRDRPRSRLLTVLLTAGIGVGVAGMWGYWAERSPAARVPAVALAPKVRAGALSAVPARAAVSAAVPAEPMVLTPGPAWSPPLAVPESTSDDDAARPPPAPPPPPPKKLQRPAAPPAPAQPAKVRASQPKELDPYDL